VVAFDRLAMRTGLRLAFTVAPEPRVRWLIERHYGAKMPRRMRELIERAQQGQTDGPSGPQPGQPNARQRGLDDPGPGLMPSISLDDVLPPLPALPPPVIEEREEVSVVTNLLGTRLEAVSSREDLAPLALEQLARYLRRAALLSIRRDGIRGWDATGPGVDREQFRALAARLDEPSVFESGARGAYYLGVLAPSAANGRLLAALGGPPRSHVIVVPVQVRDRVVSLIYGDAESDAALDRAVVPVRQLAEMLGRAFLRLILRFRQPTGPMAQ
jgi:hypothetical protein